ncbi:hypothetical protein M408DRAFT_162438 [Serendipita vermifera MAFF 305830]|uniref:Uncharacterized protein n=1 Tax=Serendipita vermifera MAFF 305830 TaxID=933852 RepID=A0A0C3ASX2_SERVB|nr:hypothetical protein M408DRAFT_162438 [Serendipita vermifera MAFF 305830]
MRSRIVQSSLRHVSSRKRCFATAVRGSDPVKAPTVAFAFDIDGVLTQGSNTLPQAKRVLRMLSGENEWNQKFPYILMTNGGGKSEAQRCKELSERLETKIDKSMFMQSHTIMGSPVLPYLDQYADKPIMVLGGIGDACRQIAHDYGYRNVVTPIDVLAWNKNIWPFHQITSEEKKVARTDFDFANTPIHAIAVFHDPRNWALDVQVCLDIVTRGSKSRPAFVSDENPSLSTLRAKIESEEPVELIFCNPDLIWRGAYAKPRLGQGGFREAFQGVHQALHSRRYPAKQLGKPTAETYMHAEDMIMRQIRGISGNSGITDHKQSIYMIGDNPESDIAGANAAGWNSILVHTGVYSPSEGPPSHIPTLEAPDVEEAVYAAISRTRRSG